MRRVGEIVGTTIDEPEMQVARALALPNYAFVLHNKYSGRERGRRRDVRLHPRQQPDEPLLLHPAPCRSVRILRGEAGAAAGRSSPTAWGSGGCRDDTNPRWGFDFDDLAAVARGRRVVGLRDDEQRVCACRDRRRRAPGVRVAFAPNWLRRAAMLPGRSRQKRPGARSPAIVRKCGQGSHGTRRADR